MANCRPLSSNAAMIGNGHRGEGFRMPAGAGRGSGRGPAYENLHHRPVLAIATVLKGEHRAWTAFRAALDRLALFVWRRRRTAMADDDDATLEHEKPRREGRSVGCLRPVSIHTGG